MFSIFNRLKKHFFLSEEKRNVPPREISELFSSNTASSFVNQKLSYAKTQLQAALNTSDYTQFYSAITQSKAALSEIIPYENEIIFSGPAPSQLLAALEKNEPNLRQAFEKRLLQTSNFDHMEGHQFENFCAALLRKNGYMNVTVTKESGDQGIDIIAYKNGLKYGIQCKRYSSNVGNKAVQEAYTGARFYDCQIGVVLTNRHFTQSAKEVAYKNGVLLWDREYLKKLILGCV